MSDSELAAAYSREPVPVPAHRLDLERFRSLTSEQLAAAYSRAPVMLVPTSVAARPSPRLDLEQFQSLTAEQLAAAYSRAPVTTTSQP